MRFSDIKMRYPKTYQKRGENFWDFKAPGGESFQEAGKRFIGGLREIALLPNAGNTEEICFVVAHVGVIRSALAYLGEIDPDRIMETMIPYASVTQLNTDVSDGNVNFDVRFIGSTPTAVPNDDEVDFTYTDANVFEPLTFNIESNGSFYWCSTLGNSGKTIQYKKNDEPWVNLTSKSIPYSSWVNVSAGDVIKLRGNNLYYATSYNDYNTFSGSTCKFSIAGNIMSLIDSTNFATLKTFSNDNNFRFLFAGCTGLTSAEKLILPVTTLTSYCYSQMFYGCTSLRTAPALPATNLASYCYDSMFNGCSSLITAPELPAITLVGYCYQGMFGYCTSLVTAPELPAEAISQYCYNSMFNGCTSLTTAPLLPSLEAHWACYSGMFQGCTSLVIAPELPATKLGYACYSNMFNGCTSLTTAPLIAAPSFYGAGNCCFRMFYNCINLNYVKCLSTNLYSTSCTQEWVYNVSPSGTFVKNANMSSWTRGMNGIPNGWTVEDAS